MKAKIYINYKEGILDPEGLTVSKALNSIGVIGIDNLSIGKCIEMELNCKTKQFENSFNELRDENGNILDRNEKKEKEILSNMDFIKP